MLMKKLIDSYVKPESGVSVIEFVLCLPIMLAFAGVVIDFGYIANRYVILQSAATDAASYVVLFTEPTSTIPLSRDWEGRQIKFQDWFEEKTIDVPSADGGEGYSQKRWIATKSNEVGENEEIRALHTDGRATLTQIVKEYISKNYQSRMSFTDEKTYMTLTRTKCTLSSTAAQNGASGTGENIIYDYKLYVGNVNQEAPQDMNTIANANTYVLGSRTSKFSSANIEIRLQYTDNLLFPLPVLFNMSAGDDPNATSTYEGWKGKGQLDIGQYRIEALRDINLYIGGDEW